MVDHRGRLKQKYGRVKRRNDIDGIFSTNRRTSWNNSNKVLLIQRRRRLVTKNSIQISTKKRTPKESY